MHKDGCCPTLSSDGLAAQARIFQDLKIPSSQPRHARSVRTLTPSISSITNLSPSPLILFYSSCPLALKLSSRSALLLPFEKPPARDSVAQKLAKRLPTALGVILQMFVFWHNAVDKVIMLLETLCPFLLKFFVEDSKT